MATRLIEEIRAKKPGMAKRAAAGSRQAAIRLFCLECMGGQRQLVSGCGDRLCSLHAFRMGRKMEGR